VKVLLPDAVYVTLLRDPVSCFESNYVYMGLQTAYGLDINEYAKQRVAKVEPLLRASISNEERSI